jgi:hypothetical protein
MAPLLFASVADAGKGGMYRVVVSEVRLQPIDEQGNATDEAKPASFTQTQEVGCHLARAPGKKPITIWFKGTSDRVGKLRRLGDGPNSEMMPSHGGAPDDAAVCALSAFTNSDFRLLPRGNFQVFVKATFTKAR